ncbi:MAG: phage tail protein [Flavobacteriaceae bacterium]
MDPMLASIMIFAGNFAPRGWSYCDGQLLSIAQNQALFSLLGTTYGGDGRTTFALPDLRGRAAIGPRHGPGLTNRPLGQRSGEETHVLSALEMPSHSHTVIGSGTAENIYLSNEAGVRSAPIAGDVPSAGTTAPAIGTGDPVNAYGPLTTANAIVSQTLNPASGLTISNTGSSQAHNNMQPYLAINYIIAMVGYFPSRN